MKFQQAAKNLTLLFLLIACLHGGCGAYAETLSFKVGDQASYTIFQKLHSHYEDCDAPIASESEATIVLDVKILSSNPETLSYPFDVEVILRKIHVAEIQQNGLSATLIRYESDGLKTLDNYILAEFLDELIDYPLNFRVESDFQVTEITGHLAAICDSYETPSQLGLFGTTPWAFELFLTQLFHLSAQDLQSDNRYPVSCYQFLNWEDEPLDEEEITLQQSSAYEIQQVDAEKIKALWHGDTVITRDHELDGHVSLISHVTWDISQPLLQKRELTAHIEESYKGILGFLDIQLKLDVQQSWVSTPLYQPLF